MKLKRVSFDDDEWKLIEGIDLEGIDLSDQANIYHLQIIEGLLSKDGNTSIFSNVVNQLISNEEKLAKVEFVKLNFSDLGKSIGTKREVDLVKLILKNGKEILFTVSIDIHPRYLDDQTESPSQREAKNLANFNNNNIKSVQKLYASRDLQIESDYSEEPELKTLICKEYLVGEMLELYLLDIDYTIDQIGEEQFGKIAYLAGYALAEPFVKTGIVVKDSNPLNFIVGTADGKLFVRYCDCDSASSDLREVALESRLLRPRFGKFARYFDQGMEDAKKNL